MTVVDVAGSPVSASPVSASPLSASPVAPPAPGRMGEPLDPTAVLAYLEALGRWVTDRKNELDQLDRAALASPDSASLTHDVMLSMALWKSVSDRETLLRTTWDSGRVGRVERERMASLVWGRMDATVDPALVARSSAVPSVAGTTGGLSVSLPEACRLSDALAAQLRVRLAFDPSGLVTADRIRQLRAQLERIREQTGLEPAGDRQVEAARRQAQLGRRLSDVADKAGRGGDVGGMLGPLEIEATTYERDLIVGAAHRREAGAKVDRVRSVRADLEIREAALRTLVEKCVAAVDPAPRYAVPDVDALGPVPNTTAALDAYLARLSQVSRALIHAQDAYSAALSARDELAGRLDALHAKAVATGVAELPDVRDAYAFATRVLDRRPTPMATATPLVALYQTFLQITSESS